MSGAQSGVDGDPRDRQLRELERELRLPRNYFDRNDPRDHRVDPTRVLAKLRADPRYHALLKARREARQVSLEASASGSARTTAGGSCRDYCLLPIAEGREWQERLTEAGIRRKAHIRMMHGCRRGVYYESGHLHRTNLWNSLLPRAASAFAQVMQLREVDKIVAYTEVMWLVGVQVARILDLPDANVILALSDENPGPVVPLEETKNQRVAVLLDAVGSGTLQQKLCALLVSAGADIVMRGALVLDAMPGVGEIYHLWEEDHVDSGGDCPLCAQGDVPLPFHHGDGTTDAQPDYGYAIQKLEKSMARNPQWWRWIAKRRALVTDFELGGAFYSVFLDVKRLLEDPRIRKDIGDEACARLGHLSALDPVVIYKECENTRPALVAKLIARRMGWECVPVRAYKRRWSSTKDLALLRGRNVLIVDAAVASGRSMRAIAALAEVWGVRSLRAFVVISRLATQEEEKAVDGMLSEPLYRVFDFPVPACRVPNDYPDEVRRILLQFADAEGMRKYCEVLLSPQGRSELEPQEDPVETTAVERVARAAVTRRPEDVLTALPSARYHRRIVAKLPGMWMQAKLLRHGLHALMHNGIETGPKVTIGRYLVRNRDYAWASGHWVENNLAAIGAFEGAVLVAAVAECAKRHPERAEELLGAVAASRSGLHVSVRPERSSSGRKFGRSEPQRLRLEARLATLEHALRSLQDGGDGMEQGGASNTAKGNTKSRADA